MHYTRDEDGWIERKAQEIARETGWPLPIARAEAQAAFVRIQQRPKAKVIPFQQERLFGSQK